MALRDSTGGSHIVLVPCHTCTLYDPAYGPHSGSNPPWKHVSKLGVRLPATSDTATNDDGLSVKYPVRKIRDLRHDSRTV